MSTPYDKLLGRVELALETASSNGMLAGEDYKMWVIDQMVRALTGCDEEETEPGVFPKHDSADYLEFRASAMSTVTEWGVKWERPGGMHIDEGLDEEAARHDSGWAVQPGCSVKLLKRTVTYGEWEEVAR